MPAFVGLGAPYWDERARGTLVGITRGTTRAHVVRATLESIAYQARDVVECVQRDSGLVLEALRVDGGACQNDFLMQFQADILGVTVDRPKLVETTAAGSAYLAGLAVGVWNSPSELDQVRQTDCRFEPLMEDQQRRELYQGWQKAVARVRSGNGENESD